MFAANNSLVSGVIVKGDIVEQPASAGKIKTRSQSKKNPEQYTAIPFPAKAIKLLLWDFKTNLENTAPAPSTTLNEADSEAIDAEDNSSDVGIEMIAALWKLILTANL